MKQTINLGAYGWLHPHWIDSFYPEDLPADWRLGYYSNEFNTVLVPADYWQGLLAGGCEHWLEDVHQGFQFFIECHGGMFDAISPADLAEALQVLKPQLSGLVFLGDQLMPDIVKKQFTALIEELGVVVFGAGSGFETQRIWRPDGTPVKKTEMSRFAFIDDDLTDPRSSRKLIEPFTLQLSDDEADATEVTMIVSHSHLQAADLTRFRSVLEIMGH